MNAIASTTELAPRSLDLGSLSVARLVTLWRAYQRAAEGLIVTMNSASCREDDDLAEELQGTVDAMYGRAEPIARELLAREISAGDVNAVAEVFIASGYYSDPADEVPPAAKALLARLGNPVW